LSSIHWREAWKYGERAFRYCQHDAGHAFAAMAVSAAALGWRMRWLNAPGDADAASLLGLMRRADFDREEPEHPDLLAVVWPGEAPETVEVPPETFEKLAVSMWHGTANRLSPNHVPWTAIDDVAKAAAKPRTEPFAPSLPGVPAPTTPATDKSARTIILQRRSAQTMDGQTAIPREAFYRTLSRLMPDRTGPFWESFAATPEIHLVVFAHRVTGLPSGLYCLVRNPDHEATLRDAMRVEFTWVRAMGCPDDLPLYLLQAGDWRQLAGQLSCGQDIAADGAFAVAMLARFEESLRTIGPWYYRTLFWETGITGQLLYLEAEASGIRGTGIGCYFDDLVHQVLGLEDRSFQSLYHFTVGGPLDDPRLTTLPPYGELDYDDRY
jgi:nitroreductase